MYTFSYFYSQNILALLKLFADTYGILASSPSVFFADDCIAVDKDQSSHNVTKHICCVFTDPQ